MRFDSDLSFNSINIDGQMSTNDLIYILENGAASDGFIIDKQNTQEVFKRESTDFATHLTKLVGDGEDTTDSFLLYLSFTSITDGRVLLHIKMLTTLPHGYPHLL